MNKTDIIYVILIVLIMALVYAVPRAIAPPEIQRVPSSLCRKARLDRYLSLIVSMPRLERVSD